MSVNQQSIGYAALSQHLLDNGVAAKYQTMQHRHILRVIGETAMGWPEVEPGLNSFRLHFFANGRRLTVDFSKMSGEQAIEVRETELLFLGRPTPSLIEQYMFWLFPTKLTFWQKVTQWLRNWWKQLPIATTARK